MKYDYVAIYNKNAAFYNGHEKWKKALLLCNIALTYLFILAYAGLWIYAFLADGFFVKDYLKIFFVPALTLFTVSVLRVAIDRPRPYAKEGANITPLLKGKSEKGDSFPSRHIASATAISFAFLPYLPLLGALLLCGCLLLSYTRFAIGVHYPTDLIAGLILGSAIGSLVFIL